MGVILTSIILFILILITHYYFASQYRISKENLENKAKSLFNMISEKIYYGKLKTPEGKINIDSVKLEVFDVKIDNGYLYAQVVAKDIYNNDTIEKKDIKAKIYEDYMCNSSLTSLCINL
jgi:hypothetical protein